MFVDFDSTLVNSREVAIQLLNERYDKNYSVEQLKKRNFSDLYPDITNDVISEVFSSDNFYRNLSFKENSLYVIKCFCKFYSISIITKENRASFGQKANWISKNVPSYIVPNIIFVDSGGTKGDIDMSNGILVDDYIDNLRESNANIKILYAPYPEAEESKITNLDEVYRVYSWYEIASILSFYMKQGKII